MPLQFWNRGLMFRMEISVEVTTAAFWSLLKALVRSRWTAALVKSCVGFMFAGSMTLPPP